MLIKIKNDVPWSFRPELYLTNFGRFGEGSVEQIQRRALERDRRELSSLLFVRPVEGVSFILLARQHFSSHPLLISTLLTEEKKTSCGDEDVEMQEAGG